MTALERILSDADVRRVFEALDGDGEELRVVGGAVRNALLGQPPGDIDMATTALPDEVIRRAKAAGLKTVPTGIDHGTVTVIAGKRPFEVTTLRRDMETDGRRATVAFGRDWAEDAARRDFTFNALSLSRDGAVHDTTGGRDDLAAGRVRFIGPARDRIAEDYLRILRFFRFHAFYGHGGPDADGFAACIAGRGGLVRLSRERVRAEMVKLIVAPGAVPTLAAMAGAGIIGALSLGVPRVHRLERMAGVERHVGLEADAVRRLAALFVVVREDAERLKERLRLSNGEYDGVLKMAAEGLPPLTPALDGRQRRQMVYWLGNETFRARALMAWADDGGEEGADWRALARFPETWPQPRLPWTGKDVMALGIRKGPDVGDALLRLEAAWIAADFPEGDAERERLLRAVTPAS